MYADLYVCVYRYIHINIHMQYCIPIADSARTRLDLKPCTVAAIPNPRTLNRRP